MKKIKFFSTIIATALIVSACTNDLGSNANSGNGVLSSTSDEACITSVSITKADYDGSGTEYTGSALVTIAKGITLEKLKSNDRELKFSDDVAPGTITLSVKNGNVYTAYTFDATCMQGKSHLFDGKNVSGIKYGAFEAAKGLSGNLIVNIPCAEGQKVIVDYVVTGYDDWINDNTETGQFVSKIPYETLGNNNGGMIVQVSLYGVDGSLQSFHPTWNGVDDVVVDYDCSLLSPKLSGKLIVNIPCADGQQVVVDYWVTGIHRDNGEEDWTNVSTFTGKLETDIPYESLGNNNGGMIVQVSLASDPTNPKVTLQSFYPIWDGKGDVIVDYDCSALTPGGDETPHFVSAVVTSFSTNLQNGNNNNFKFSVTVTMSDGSTFVEDHTETINAQQSGSKTFDYANYSVYVAWNDNNTVTTCKVVP